MIVAKLLDEQIETNRLLRQLVGEPAAKPASTHLTRSERLEAQQARLEAKRAELKAKEAAR
ncbi:MAG: hypothetical protein M3Q39_10085 [Actinomycetota bacterium]|nr:hypothetical protein [Actinomycetota bacterium]